MARVDRMIDRCKRICGGAKGLCYTSSNEQMRCIADMVINKTSTIAMLLNMHLSESGRGSADENVRESLAAANELSNWIRYLQLVDDRCDLHALVLERDQRREIRYPLSEAFRGYVSAHVKLSDSFEPVAIRNFSQSGLQFISRVPLKALTRAEGKISLPSKEGEVHFKAGIRYCSGQSQGYIIGARLEEVAGTTSFNFFNSVFSIITECRAAAATKVPLLKPDSG